VNKAETQINQIKSKLKSLENKESMIRVITGLNLVVILVLVINIIVSLLELSGLNNIASRTVLFYVGTLFSVFGFCFFVGIPIFKRIRFLRTPNYKTLSEKIGEYQPEIGDKLHNVLDLYEDKNKFSSETLTVAAIESVYEKTKNVDFRKASTYLKTKKYFIASAVTIVFTTLLFYIVPSLRSASYRIINYSNKFIKTAKFEYYIEPGNISTLKNSTIKIRIETIGEAPKQITIFTKSEEEPAFIEHISFPDSNMIFNLQLNSLKKSTEYYAEAENIRSNLYRITVIDKPLISELKLTIIPPKYSGLEKYSQIDNGNIKELKGSKVELYVGSTKELTSGHLIFSDSSKQSLSVSKTKGNTSFIIENSREYKIIVYDSTLNKNKNPITYTITSKADEHPKLNVIEPELNIKLTKSEQVLTHLNISDDYGFKKLLLHHRLSASSFEKPEEKFSNISITLNGKKKEQEIYFVWDVSDLLLTAGDVISFYFEIFDNDNISGPKSTKSSLYTLYVPTIDELFDESETVQDEVVKELQETMKEAEKLNEDMEKLSNELKLDDEEINWEEKKKTEETMQKLEELKSKIKKVQEKLSKNQNKLEQNDLLSEETLEKYNELQKLMEEMNSEEMKQSMSKLQKQLESMNRENTQKSLEEAKFNEEMFRKSLERTVNLLKRIQIEQKLDEIVKRTEEIRESLSELEKETEKSDLSNNEQEKNLSKKQESITEQLKKLKEETEKLKQKMSEFKDMPNEQMEKLQKELDSQRNEELSKKAEEQISKEMKMEAMEQMQMLSQNMERTSQQMQNMQQQMQMENQLQTMYDMMKSVNSLIDLSKKEEELKKLTENSGANQQLKNTQTQNEILSGLQKTIGQLSELSQKSFAITPEMGKALGQAKAEMQNSINAMQNKNSSLAVQSQSGAMKNINEAASMMKGKMDQMMNGGQGGGMMSMMQQMQQLSQQQKNLNKLTQQLNKGELTQQQQMEMQKLSQQQQMIKKSLAQLNKESKESGESKRVASNLEQILKDMEEVITKMKTEKLSDDLIQSQEKILSKLLDAQRSINQRDFEENRESNLGKRFNRESPDEINLSNEEKENKIRDELMKAIKEGYTQDYEDLIRKYYESLDESKTPAKN